MRRAVPGLQLSPRRGAPDVHGYFVFDRPPATDITGLSPYPWAAGAITANVSEVAQYYRALLTGRLVDSAILSAMKSTVSEGAKADFRGSRTDSASRAIRRDAAPHGDMAATSPATSCTR
jgi:hypothetical protein